MRSALASTRALRGIAVVAALGLLLAEWAALHHRAAAGFDDGHGDASAIADHAAHPDDGGEAPALRAYDALAAGELAHEPCQICQSSRERFAAAAGAVSYATGRADPSAAPPAETGTLARGVAVHAVAPKTSPPA